MNAVSSLIGAGLALTRTIRGERIVYRRGELSVTIANAKPLNLGRREDREGQATLQTDEMGWGIGRGDLVLGGQATEPRRNDRIEWVCQEQTLTYTVLPPPDEKQCWSWADTGHTEYAVSCKLTEKD